MASLDGFRKAILTQRELLVGRGQWKWSTLKKKTYHEGGREGMTTVVVSLTLGALNFSAIRRSLLYRLKNILRP